MASRQDDANNESQPPAGLTFGRRVTGGKEGAGGRGQVKGVFGVTGASQARTVAAEPSAPEVEEPAELEPADLEAEALPKHSAQVPARAEGGSPRAAAPGVFGAAPAATADRDFQGGQPRRALKERPRSAGLTAFGRTAEGAAPPPARTDAGFSPFDDDSAGGASPAARASMRPEPAAQRGAGLTAFGRQPAADAGFSPFDDEAPAPAAAPQTPAPARPSNRADSQHDFAAFEPEAALPAPSFRPFEGELGTDGQSTHIGGFSAFEDAPAAAAAPAAEEPEEFAAFEGELGTRTDPTLVGGFTAVGGEVREVKPAAPAEPRAARSSDRSQPGRVPMLQQPAPGDAGFTPFEGEVEEPLVEAEEESFFGEPAAEAPAERRRGLASVPPPRAAASTPPATPEAAAAPADDDKAGRSGMRHKRVEADEGQQRMKSGPPAPRRVSARPERRAHPAVREEGALSGARTAASVPPEPALPSDPRPPVHAPRWWMAAAILLVAVIGGGGFMWWSLRTTRGATSAPTSGQPAGGLPGADEIATWSPHSAQATQNAKPGAEPGTASAAPSEARVGEAPAAAGVPKAAAPGEAAPAAAAAQPTEGSGAAPAEAPRPQAQAAPEGNAAAAEPGKPGAAEPAPQAAADAPAATDAPAGDPAAPAGEPAAAEDPAKSIPTWLALARKRLAREDSRGAETMARRVLNVDPQNIPGLRIMAQALMDQDRGREALPFARKLVQQSPRKAANRLLLGDVLLMIGDNGAAKAEWQRALELSPDDAETRRRLGL